MMRKLFYIFVEKKKTKKFTIYTNLILTTQRENGKFLLSESLRNRDALTIREAYLKVFNPCVNEQLEILKNCDFAFEKERNRPLNTRRIETEG